jgi:hypothetical protein
MRPLYRFVKQQTTTYGVCLLGQTQDVVKSAVIENLAIQQYTQSVERFPARPCGW